MLQHLAKCWQKIVRKPTVLKNVVTFLKNVGRSLKNREKYCPAILKK
jgi:hypothetical protein